MSAAQQAQQYVAFLRAINVGGHVVKMEVLRELFEAVPLASVSTFIASGNVAFESPSTDTQALEKKIERMLQTALGYEVATFVRSASALREIAAYQPFGEVAADHTMSVGFLAAAPGPGAIAAVTGLRTEVDEFHVHGREIYWLCRTRQSETLVTGPRLAKALAMPTTFRNVTTVKRLVAKYPASPSSTARPASTMRSKPK